MIRGLVQEEEIVLFEQKAREREAHLLTRGEAAHGRSPQRLWQAEAAERGRSAGHVSVPSAFFKPVLRLAQGLKQPGRLFVLIRAGQRDADALDVLFHRPQIGERLHRHIEACPVPGPRIRVNGRLLQVADAGACRNRHLPRVGDQTAEHDLKQTGLPCAVLPDQRHPVSAMDGQ